MNLLLTIKYHFLLHNQKRPLFHQVLYNSGITFKGETYGVHTLRHTFATRCIEVGMDVKTLSENKVELFDVHSGNILYNGDYYLIDLEFPNSNYIILESLNYREKDKLINLESNMKCFPTLSPACLPNRYKRVFSSRLIHKEFEEELARLD